MFRNMDEVKESEKYAYFRDLGYTEKEAIVLSLIDFDANGKIGRVMKEYLKQKKEGFVDYVSGHYFSDQFKEKPKKKNRNVYSSIVGSGSGGVMLKKLSNLMYNTDYEYKEDEEDDELDLTGAVYSCRPVYSISPFFASTENELRELIENVRTDSYELIEKKNWRNTVDSPTATFRPTYNTAAAGILLSNNRKGSLTRTSMVRIEELLNYLSYDLKAPHNKKFEVTKEVKKVGNEVYLFLGVQGKKILPEKQNICILLDVSGSMTRNKDSMITVIATVLAKMNSGDVFSLVTYSDKDHVIINGLKLNEDKNIEDILEMLARIDIDGYTNGSAGLNKAYEIIEKNMIDNGVNRVIIITDGDLNFGIHDKDGLKGLIEKKRESGAYFSAIGTGIYNLQDDNLEALAKNGNGNYFVVNELSDVRKSVCDKYEALVYPIAKNVKAQVEFNPGRVKAWKLIGYEKRMLHHEDFRNDKVIAEPFGSGSYFIALFRLVMNEGEMVKASLKYLKTELVQSQEIGTLTVRFEDVKDTGIKELEFTIEDTLTESSNIEKAIECADLAERLRDSNVDELTRMKLSGLLEDQ